MATISTFLNLPNDLLSRILVGVPLDDHRATASVCRAFRDVINGPNFPALRQRYGFAERGVVLVGVGRLDDDVSIRLAHKSGVQVTHLLDYESVSRLRKTTLHYEILHPASQSLDPDFYRRKPLFLPANACGHP